MMTPEQRQYQADYIAHIANRMGLQDWQVTVLAEPCHDNAGASIICTSGKKNMDIRLSSDWHEMSQDAQREALIREFTAHELNHAHFDLASEFILRLLHSKFGAKEAEFYNDTFQWLMEYGIDALARVIAPNLPLPSDFKAMLLEDDVEATSEGPLYNCPRCSEPYTSTRTWRPYGDSPNPICLDCIYELDQTQKQEKGQTFRYDYDADKCLKCNRSLLPSEKFSHHDKSTNIVTAPLCEDCYNAAGAMQAYLTRQPLKEAQKPYERGSQSERCPHCGAEATASIDWAWSSDEGRMVHNCQQQLEAEGVPTEPHVEETPEPTTAGVCC